MKIKSITKALSLLIIMSTVLSFGCKHKPRETLLTSTNAFDGLYILEYENWDKQHIWIFTKDVLYTLYSPSPSSYSNPVNNVAYEKPVHYYLKGDKLYTCGIDITTGKATTLEKCLKDSYDPNYKIISTDTIQEIDGRGKKIIIQLEKYHGKEQMKLTKHL